MSGRRDPGWKRVVDVGLAVVLLILTLPVTIVAAVAIRVTSPGPIFYRQVRVGKNGRHFRIFKFRSMVIGAEKMGLGLAVARDDDRITSVGRLLRRLSIDEVPQLLNVLAGHMSLVGPRPTVPSQVNRYTPYERRRLEMRPGITGWAQVQGRNALSWRERIDRDIWYIDHCSPGLDLEILLHTLPVVLGRGENLYGESGVTEDYQGESHRP